MTRMSGSFAPFLLSDDGTRIVGIRAGNHYDSYFVNQWHGAWRSTETQEAGEEDVPIAVTLNTVDFESGISVVDDSRITVSDTGVYELTASFQLSNDSGTIYDVKFWVRVNGQDAAFTSRVVYVPAQHAGDHGHATFTASHFFPMNAGDYAEIIWQTPSLDVTLETKAADGGPAAPSVFASMSRIA